MHGHINEVIHGSMPYSRCLLPSRAQPPKVTKRRPELATLQTLVQVEETPKRTGGHCARNGLKVRSQRVSWNLRGHSRRQEQHGNAAHYQSVLHDLCKEKSVRTDQTFSECLTTTTDIVRHDETTTRHVIAATSSRLLRWRDVVVRVGDTPRRGTDSGEPAAVVSAAVPRT